MAAPDVNKMLTARNLINTGYDQCQDISPFQASSDECRKGWTSIRIPKVYIGGKEVTKVVCFKFAGSSAWQNDTCMDEGATRLYAEVRNSTHRTAKHFTELAIDKLFNNESTQGQKKQCGSIKYRAVT